MARTKQTARKNTGGKPLAMGRGRGKGNPKLDPKQGGRSERKVVLKYSSDESLDKDNPQQVEGAEAPKRVKKQIHLTLPTSPAHVTTTESFTAFFINHGLTRALQKAFAKRGWSTDQMREFVANFQQKYGQQVPMPKIYRDKDSSDSEGLELADGTTVSKKTAGGAGSSGGGKPCKKSAASGHSSGAGGSGGGDGARAGGGSGPSTSGSSGIGGSKGRKRGQDDDGDDDDPNKCRKTGMKVDHQNRWWPVKNHAKRAQFTPRSTESCQSSTSLTQKREPCWAIACWTGLRSRRRRYMRRGCRGDR